MKQKLVQLERVCSGWMLCYFWGDIATIYRDGEIQTADEQLLNGWLDKYSSHSKAHADCAAAFKQLLGQTDISAREIYWFGCQLHVLHRSRSIGGSAGKTFKKIFKHKYQHPILRKSVGADRVRDIIASLFQHWGDFYPLHSPSVLDFNASRFLGTILDLASPTDVKRYRFARDIALRVKHFNVADKREALFMVAEYYLFYIRDLLGFHCKRKKSFGDGDYFEWDGLLELMRECGFYTAEHYID
jgi:hypothetical protein